MAEGRMVLRSIASNEQLEKVSFEADFLFARCIPFLDVEGRMPGQPGRVRAMVCPLRPEMTTAVVERALTELADAELVVWYDTPGGKVLSFPSFHRHNKVRRDREAPSKFPPPPGAGPDGSGTAPGELRENSGSTPGELHLEGKEGEVQVLPSAPAAPARAALMVIPGDAPTDRRAAVARLVDLDGPEQLAECYLRVSHALEPENGRDVLVEVLTRAALGPDHPSRFLRAMHDALHPLTGAPIAADLLRAACIDWLGTADNLGHRLFRGYLRNAKPAPPAPPREDRAPTGRRLTAGEQTRINAREGIDALLRRVAP